MLVVIMFAMLVLVMSMALVIVVISGNHMREGMCR